MTGVVSEDALKSQSNRIMNALRAATQQNSQGGDLRNIASSLTSQAGGGSYFDSMNKLSGQQMQQDIDAETGIYNQMKEQAARGNAEAKSVDEAISEVAGADPKIYASLLNDLHNDPEDINATNARAKVMKYAAERGIVPLNLQKDKLLLEKTRSDIARSAREASGEDVGATGNIIKKIATERNIPFSQAAYLYQTGFRGDKQYDESGNIIPISGSLKTKEDIKRAEKKGAQIGDFEGKSITDLPRIEDQTNTAIGLINQLKNHPGLKQAVGASSALPVVPGTDAADFVSRLEQVQGQNFLQAFNQLKGGGQITEIEGTKAQNAIARLQRSQTEPEFKKSLDDLNEILQRGLERAQKSAGAAVTQVAPKRLKYNPSTGEFE